MQRVKNIDYDEDDLHSDDEYEATGNGAEEYSAEDRENFATLTPVVRAELDEAGIPTTTIEIEEALWHYFWDVGKSVAYLKNSKVPKKQQQQKKQKTLSKFDEAAQKSAQNAGKAKPDNAVDSLASKAGAIKLDLAPSVAAPHPKVRSQGLNVPKLWAESKTKRKPSAAFVVIGHVDHGKSTLMGRLLLDTSAVSQRDIDRYKKQAAELGKASFALAWVMDTGSEERERGVTVDIAQHHFTTANVDFTILDAPGHRDFVPNMLAGASMADLAVLVVDANQLDSGLKGQTREHIVLAYAVGIRHIIVAVNKLDATSPGWSQDVLDSVSNRVRNVLVDTGFVEANIAIVPCSGLNGENVVEPPPAGSSAEWMRKIHPTLLQQLENFASTSDDVKTVEQQFRMQISDVFRGGVTNPLSVSGRISSGNLQTGDSLIIRPSGEQATIKGIEVGGQPRDWAVASEICTLHLLDINPQYLRSGDIVCSSGSDLPLVQTLLARIDVLETLLPQEADLHLGRLHVPVSIRKLISIVDGRADAVIKNNPRVVKAGQTAKVQIALEIPQFLENGDRIILRSDGSTIASGTVLETLG